VVFDIDREPARTPELAGARSLAPPLGQWRARGREFLNAVVVTIGDEDVSQTVQCKAHWTGEPSRLRAFTTPPGERHTTRRQLVDQIVASVRHKDIAIRIQRDPSEAAEFA